LLGEVGKVVHLNFKYFKLRGGSKMTFKSKEEELQYYREKEEKTKLISLKLRIKNQLLTKKAVESGITVSKEEIEIEVKRILSQKK
jgi:hypothetical protein